MDRHSAQRPSEDSTCIDSDDFELEWEHDSPGLMADQFFEFVDDPRFPCVGSKAALAKGAIRAKEFFQLGDLRNDGRLLGELEAFGSELDSADPRDKTVRSFVALFQGPRIMDEKGFEVALWGQLQRLHELDVAGGNPWAPDVVPDPQDPKFSLSLGGHPFFVIGLHPGSSRLARRFAWPTLVFNSHRQFEDLRSDGRYQKMQRATRKRDIALQGSINPNLADFGGAAESRQYSGRKVSAEWTCPFKFEGSK